MRQFDHEKMAAYQRALEFANLALELIANRKGIEAKVVDQLTRAASSVCLNIAEGAGEFVPKEKARFYRMARRSAFECAAALDLIAMRVRRREPNAPASNLLSHGRSLLLEIVSMLIALGVATDRRHHL